MGKNCFAKASLVCLLCAVTFLSSCCINIGGWLEEKWEKTVQVSAPVGEGSTVVAETEVGSITVTGADVNDCSVVAKICAKASSEEKARELAEKVQIKLEPAGKRLKIKIEKPRLGSHRSISISLDIRVPKQTAVELESDVGEIRIFGIGGRIKAESEVGSISCEEISGDIDLESNVGAVKVVYAKTAPAACNATISTDVGVIDFTGPPNLSARLDIHTDVGSIKTDREIKVVGEISKSRIKGTIGAGEGKLNFETDVGSIEIK